MSALVKTCASAQRIEAIRTSASEKSRPVLMRTRGCAGLSTSRTQRRRGGAKVSFVKIRVESWCWWSPALGAVMRKNVVENPWGTIFQAAPMKIPEEEEDESEETWEEERKERKKKRQGGRTSVRENERTRERKREREREEEKGRKGRREGGKT